MIRNFVHEIGSSLLMGEWVGFENTVDDCLGPQEEFLLMNKGLVFDGYYFYLMGKRLDTNLTCKEVEVLSETFLLIRDRYYLDNPTEDVLELAGRFGGIAAKGKE